MNKALKIDNPIRKKANKQQVMGFLTTNLPQLFGINKNNK